MEISLFKPILSAIFVNHINGKIQINAEILHFSYPSNKPIKRNL